VKPDTDRESNIAAVDNNRMCKTRLALPLVVSKDEPEKRKSSALFGICAVMINFIYNFMVEL
jgi:hypothetical protein